MDVRTFFGVTKYKDYCILPTRIQKFAAVNLEEKSISGNAIQIIQLH